MPRLMPRLMPREPVFAVGREGSVGKGAGVPTLKGSPSPLLLESFPFSFSNLESYFIPPAPSWHQGSVPRRRRGWSCGVLSPGWTVGQEDPPAGWPGHPLPLSDKSGRVAVRARCPRRGERFIRLKCFCNGGDRQAPSAASAGATPGSRCQTVPLRSPADPRRFPKGLLGLPEGTLCIRALAPNSILMAPLGVCSWLGPHLSGAPKLCPSCSKGSPALLLANHRRKDTLTERGPRKGEKEEEDWGER